MYTPVTITSAVALSDKQLSRLTEGLKNKYGQVEIQQRIDEKLLGGLKITVGSEQFDASLSAKISQLRQNLQ